SFRACCAAEVQGWGKAKGKGRGEAGQDRKDWNSESGAGVGRREDPAGHRRLQQGRKVDHRADRHRAASSDLREGGAPLAHSPRSRRAQRGRRGRHGAHRRDPTAVEDQALAPGRGPGEGKVTFYRPTPTVVTHIPCMTWDMRYDRISEEAAS